MRLGDVQADPAKGCMEKDIYPDAGATTYNNSVDADTGSPAVEAIG
jgi:hypothetical protein